MTNDVELAPRFLIAEEAAELMRTQVSTLYYWRRHGRGPMAKRVGKRLVYDRDDVIAWLKSPVTGD